MAALAVCAVATGGAVPVRPAAAAQSAFDPAVTAIVPPRKPVPPPDILERRAPPARMADRLTVPPPPDLARAPVPPDGRTGPPPGGATVPPVPADLLALRPIAPPRTDPPLPPAAMRAPAPPVPEAPAARMPLPAEVPAGDRFTVTFAPRSQTPPDSALPLLAGLAARLDRAAQARLQLTAYAEGGPEAPPQMARRLALKRALAVRQVLIDHGVRSTRIDVRALGDAATEGPADRVDLVVVNE